jgi:ABC-type multidrug transport system fused ATPase/permease subunit
MKITKDIKNIFIKKEINKFWIIFLGIFITTILDAVSFATIIPIFNIIFLNKLPSIPFFDNQILELTFNLKIIFLLIFICIFYLKNLFVIAFNFFYLDFLRSIDLRIANDLFKNYLSQEYKYFLQKSSENFLQKVNNDVIALNNFLAGCLSFCIELIFLFTICLILLIANYQIFLICFISFFIILFIYYKLFKKRIHQWADVYRTATGKVQSLVMNGSQGFKDIILYDLKKQIQLSIFEYDFTI